MRHVTAMGKCNHDSSCRLELATVSTVSSAFRQLRPSLRHLATVDLRDMLRTACGGVPVRASRVTRRFNAKEDDEGCSQAVDSQMRL
jgi:hypothetical protein